MTAQKHIKRIHEGQYVAEIEVTLNEFDKAWGPYLENADVLKLDRVRRALRSNDIKEAMKHARVFRLTPVTAA